MQAVARLGQRLVQLGLEGAHFSQVLDCCCAGLNAAGIPLMRGYVTLRATNPEFGGLAHHWERYAGTDVVTFEHVVQPPERWLTSPLHYLLEHDITELRQRLDVADPTYEFPVFDEFRARDCTDYIAFKMVFSKEADNLPVAPNRPPEGCLVSFTGDGETGFSDAHLAAMRTALPPLVLSLKAGSNRQMAEDIATTYLGKDAGRHVLSGDVRRGSVRAIEAVICYFDLSGFTRLSETLDGPDIIDMLNAYFEGAVEAVHAQGGNVLKFMGDGMLAVFDVEKVADANLAALAATLDLRDRMAAISAARAGAGAQTTGFTLALHRGEVLYGNIGGRNRLDFTVIGPAVNTAARLSAMCAHVDQNIVISANVARPMLEQVPALVSLGSYRLRGVTERQELFTLD